MIITQTPLRISIAGGGTDLADYYKLNGGYVVSTAIDKYIYVIVKERYDDKIYVDYAQKEIVDNVNEINHELVREAAKMTGMSNGFEVAMLADIPSEGSGLGSSSTLTVGLLNAFYQYLGINVETSRLAEEACKIEIDILGKPIGKQDQYIAAYGGICGIKFNKDESVIVEKFNIPTSIKRRFGSNLMLFFTNIVRKAANILSEQKDNISINIEFHNEIKELAYKTYEALNKGNLDLIGEILNKNWELKRKLASGITNSTIDGMYNLAIKGGALGGKICGAGGGGFLMTYCKRNEQDSLRESMVNYREMPFMLEPHGTKIVFNQMPYSWK
ncbi:MAG: GHMP kinase [Chlorobi bacterium]|nr:GHMP kinase [Chlorobiota bacterium]